MATRKVVPKDFNESDFISSFTSAPDSSVVAKNVDKTVNDSNSNSNREEPKEVNPPTKTAKGRRSKREEYLSIFFEPKDDISPRFGKTVPIRPEHHQMIQQITKIITDEKITIFNYIDNVLSYHLEYYEREIAEEHYNKLPNKLKQKFKL